MGIPLAVTSQAEIQELSVIFVGRVVVHPSKTMTKRNTHGMDPDWDEQQTIEGSHWRHTSMTEGIRGGVLLGE